MNPRYIIEYARASDGEWVQEADFPNNKKGYCDALEELDIQMRSYPAVAWRITCPANSWMNAT